MPQQALAGPSTQLTALKGLDSNKSLDWIINEPPNIQKYLTVLIFGMVVLGVRGWKACLSAEFFVFSKFDRVLSKFPWNDKYNLLVD